MSNDVRLTHKSKEFQDAMLAEVMDEKSISEDNVRQIIFDCYCKAFVAGYSKGIEHASHREDMGR